MGEENIPGLLWYPAFGNDQGSLEVKHFMSELNICFTFSLDGQFFSKRRYIYTR